LTLTGDRVGGGTDVKPPIRKDVALYGPGDIVGIDRSAIIKMEPRNGITNFEPNYLAYLEFYDEDFPWRYSPMTAANHRLHPWIMLVVLKTEEFTEGKNVKDRPLPYVNLEGGVQLPPSDQLWAWAHVHVNKNILGTPLASDAGSDIGSTLAAVVRANPDVAYSRILCPRKLEEKQAYHAFLVPVFETGRLAGLGQDPAGASTPDALAWSPAVTPNELPYYHRWSFRTGSVGDFEYLVRLLKPQPADSRVGLRDMDVQEPGANIRGILDAADATEEQRLHGILKLGGALRLPDILYSLEEFAVVEKYRKWATLNGTAPYPHPFQRDLAAFVNLADSYSQTSAAQANSEAGIDEVKQADDPTVEFDIGQNPDPLITAPLYGRWHALAQRLLTERDGTSIDPNDNWVHDLNLDPRWRVAAGFGTKIVQQNQEAYMQAAWEQIGEVLESNKRIRQGQLAKETAWVWHTTHLKPLVEKHASKWLTVAAPLQARVLSQGMTVAHRIDQSTIPRVIFSPKVRKLMSPRGRLVKRLPFSGGITPSNLVERLNRAEVTAAPPRAIPAVPTDRDVANDLKPRNVPRVIVELLERYPWLKWSPLVLALLLVVLLIVLGPGALLQVFGWAIVVGLGFLYRLLDATSTQIGRANSVLAENQTPEAVARLPMSPDFRISEPADRFTPTTGGTGDSVEAARFKQALRNVNIMVQESIAQGARPVKSPADIGALSGAMFTRLDPLVTVPSWVWAGVIVPGRIKDQQEEDFVEAMAYPEIDQPMYKPLADHSSELFLPNINFLAENSISLLETNQQFIESYMVGLNHEFARELLWREYPTDQRGSYFRQFWEPQGFHATEGLSAEELRERLKDIPPIHRWLKRSDLGDHDQREMAGDKEEEVVLVIRGELLKRYPNAVIYAHRAVWRDKNGDPILDPQSGQTIDLTRERDLRPLSPTEEANPPRDILKTPLYEAKVDPDIYFFGFDLTACKAKGGTGTQDEAVDPRCAAEGVQWHDPGWFFVIKERPGEIAMGLDVPGDDDTLDDVKVWNDLSWTHVAPLSGGHLQITSATPTITLRPLAPDEIEKKTQQDEDLNISWNKDMSSADLAYVLYQVPVLVAVHASEMLPRD
ncbi:MAG: hypothetical protein ACREMX_00070, partial [Gemmatimonadales bacterium]